MIQKNSFLRLCLIIMIAGTLLLGNLSTVHAAEISDGESLPAGETVTDDLFISGETVQVDGTVEGTLIAAGQSVILTGHVTGDAMLFGAEILVAEDALIDGNLFLGSSVAVINGTVSGSIFGGGASIVLGQTASITRNVYFGGYSLEMLRGSQIDVDLFSGVYQAILSGDILRDAVIGAGAIELNGTIGGDARFDVEAPNEYTPTMQYWVSPDMPQLPESIPTGLRISEGAMIDGELVLTSPIDQSSAIQGNVANGIVFQTPIPEEGHQVSTTTSPATINMSRSNWFGSILQRMITLLLLGITILWLAPKFINRPVEEMAAKPGYSALYGFVAVAVNPLALVMGLLLFIVVGIVLSLVSLGGMVGPWFMFVGAGLSFAVAAFIFLMFTGSIIVTCYMVGALIYKRAAPQLDANKYLVFLVGVAVYVLVTAIPFLGFLVKVAAGLFGLGAIILAIWPKKAVVVTEQAPIL